MNRSLLCREEPIALPAAFGALKPAGGGLDKTPSGALESAVSHELRRFDPAASAIRRRRVQRSLRLLYGT